MLSWRAFKEDKDGEESLAADLHAKADTAVPDYETDHTHGREDLNADGGLDPENDEELRRFEAADLITLPSDVPGTNCANCGAYKHLREGMGWCQDKRVAMFVTPRMCCKFWDNKGVKRPWGEMKESQVYQTSADPRKSLSFVGPAQPPAEVQKAYAHYTNVIRGMERGGTPVSGLEFLNLVGANLPQELQSMLKVQLGQSAKQVLDYWYQTKWRSPSR